MHSEKRALEEELAWHRGNGWTVSLDALGLGHLSGSISWTQRMALIWLMFMDSYIRQVKPQAAITAWRYADLNQRRQETLTRLFATCGLPAEAVNLALAGFERDSQAGTVLARSEESQGNPIQLTDEQVEEARAIVGCHPTIRTPDFIVPNTIMAEVV